MNSEEPDEHKQVQQFADALDALVERFRDEYDLCYASAIGALHMKIWLLCQEGQDRYEGEKGE